MPQGLTAEHAAELAGPVEPPVASSAHKIATEQTRPKLIKKLPQQGCTQTGRAEVAGDKNPFSSLG